MADTAITTYLTKQIKVNQNIVTFRLLSRALSIHVNEAKAALESFYQSDKKSGGGGSLHATYILTGEDITQKVESESMDVDGDQDLQDAPSPMADAIVPLKMLVVPEECLESCKSSFRSIRAIHIYSVEPSTFRDPSLLATTVDAVRKVDAAHTQEELCKLGIPISKACKYNTNIKGKPKVAQTSTPVISGKPQAAKDDKGKKSEVKTETKSTATAFVTTTTTAAKPEAKVEPAKKTSSTLDWSKAKSKTATTNPKPQEKVAESSKAAAKVKPEPKKTNAARAPSVSSSAASEAPQTKRGIKRAMVDSDEEEGEEDPRPAKAKARTSAPTASKSIAHTKKGVLVSDDEDDDEDAPRSRVVRGKAKSERAMMEWSDEEDVMVASRHTPGPPSTKFDTGGEDEDEDEAEAEQSSLGEEELMETSDKEDEPTYAKTKRTAKKKKTAWPVGTNGLRKRRVVKTREFEDDRGFMQYEDYSEYESVNSESEQPPEPVSVSATTTTKKAAQKTASTSKPQKQQQQQQQQDAKKFTKAVPPPTNKEGDSFAKAKPKAPAKGTGKNTIASFFQKK
ncbi:hypothetical protein FRC16_010233 [Serendipita sp. 398]|nr:hypothetical protein FRC16_010233 [Serendipita sp. 398]